MSKITKKVLKDAMADLDEWLQEEIEPMKDAYIEHEESLKISMAISFGEGTDGFEVKPSMTFSKGKVTRAAKKVYNNQMKLQFVE